MTEPVHAVLLFHTSNHALRAEKVLRDAGIECKLMPVPRHLSSDCGVCLRLRDADRQRALPVVTGAHVEIAACHPLMPAP